MDYITIDIETEKGLVAFGHQPSGEAPKSVRDVPVDIQRVLEDPMVPVVEHTKYDAVWLRRNMDVHVTNVHDTQVMAWVLNENQPLDLESLVLEYLGETMDKRIVRRSGKVLFTLDDGTLVPLSEVPWDQMERYSLDDVQKTSLLYEKLLSLMSKQAWKKYWLEEEVPFTQVLIDMECNGIPIDLDDTKKMSRRLQMEMAEEENQLLREADLPSSFNLGSPPQLRAFLFSKVFEMQEALDLGPEGVKCLKSCLGGEHEDCEDAWVLDTADVPWSGHIKDLLPPRFEIEHVGRTKVHGTYTLKGRGLKSQAVTPKCQKKECDHRRKKDHIPSTATPDLLVGHAEDEWVRKLCMSYRKKRKVVNTYLEPFPEVAVRQGACGGRVHNHDLDPTCEETDRIYGRFNQTGTKTGRLSSSDPNLQNIPSRGELGKQVRGLFRGNFILGDYSQLEPRLMAHFSQDPVLLDVYRRGKDIYLVTAEGIFGKEVTKEDPERGIAKTLFLGDQYGAGVRKLKQVLALGGFIFPQDRVEEFRHELHSFYEVLNEWKESIRAFAKDKGYVKTLAGRFRRLRYQFKNYKTMGYGERQAVNAVIQGSAGDVVRRAMIACHKAFPELRLLAQVHDEMLWEWGAVLDPSKANMDKPRPELLLPIITEICINPGFELDVPLRFDPHVVTSWAEKDGVDVDLTELYEEAA